MPTDSLTPDQAGIWLTREEKTWNSNVVQYSFVDSFPSGYGGAQGFQQFNTDQQNVTKLALDLWSDVTGLTFMEVGADEAADIRFFGYDIRVPDQVVGDEPVTDPTDTQDDVAPGAAYAHLPDNTLGSDVRVNTNWSGWAGLGGGVAGLDGIYTLLHEIGHALGLSHPGNYDVDFISADADGDGDTDLDDDALNYDTWAEYIEDSSQYTLMSYWTEYNTGADFNFNRPLTPMLHDIAAIQQPDMYGPAPFTRFGDTVYGFNSNANRVVYRFDDLTDINGTRLPVFSVYDTGGEDTFDFSGYSDDQRIDLNPGAFSDVAGLVANISIWTNTFIENAIGGSGDDEITGNDLANELEGGDGDDTIGGGDGDDIIHGNDGEDWLHGGDGEDQLYGDNNGDNVFGDDDDDTLYGGGGVDFLYGGDGADWISGDDDGDYIWGEDYDSAVYGINAAAEMDAGIGFGDNLFGGNGGDAIYGGFGEDTIEGGEGDDYLEGGPGSDFIVGGGGIDTIGYTYTAFDWEIRLDLGQARINGAVHELFYLIENADMGSGDDLVIGSNQANTVWGNLGDDTIQGNGGSDTLYGSFGDDDLYGGEDSDYLYGGDDRDQLFGGNDWDVLEGGDGGDELHGENGGDLLRGGDGDDEASGGNDDDAILGDDGDDTLAGDNGDDVLIGGRGDDTVYGNSDDDRIIWGPGHVDGPWPHITDIGGTPDDKGDVFDGDDKYDGGTGIDTVDYAGTKAGIYVDLSLSADQGTGTEIGIDQITNIENVIGGDGIDTLRGDSNDNHLIGGESNDILADGLGDDILQGDNGNDLFVARAGAILGGPISDNDVFNGGFGMDTLNYAAATVGIQIYLHSGNLFGAPTAYGSVIGVDSLYDIENAIGGSGNDIIEGSGFANVLQGGGGNDTMFGGAGTDSIYGEAGDDRIRLDADDDTLNGGEGFDTLDALGVANGISLNIGAGIVSSVTTGVDTFSNFEFYNGSSHADFVTGSTEADAMNTQGGNDTIYAMGGADIIEGGGGDDVIDGGDGGDDIDGGAGADTASYGSSGAYVNVQLQYGIIQGGHATGDVLTSIENLTGSSFNDTLFGNQDDNVLRGGSGNDQLRGLNGADELMGEAGDDWLYVDSLDTVATGGSGTDRLMVVNANGVTNAVGLNEIEIATGNAGDDTFDGTGATVALTLRGLSGNDVLTGGSEDDNIFGGAGADQLFGGDGLDRLRIDENDTVIDGGAGDEDRVIALQLATALTGVTVDMAASNVEVAYGAMHDDTFDGSGSVVALSLYGGNGQDVLIGGSANDHLFGDNNDTAQGDILNGGQGNDHLRGGENGPGGFAERDQFVFDDDWGDDRIFDFADNGAEKIDFSSIAGITQRSDLSITDGAGFALISYSNGISWTGTIRVDGVTAAELQDNDFIFV
ncbi:MAG: M10 family metallopeptidase C-terminal domain-containing protein [Rhodobiaceae bacterium]|nr:M10 family metallopeptidase C-terminal domain-containing protein [Rhodobiaceae bacterium]